MNQTEEDKKERRRIRKKQRRLEAGVVLRTAPEVFTGYRTDESFRKNTKEGVKKHWVDNRDLRMEVYNSDDFKVVAAEAAMRRWEDPESREKAAELMLKFYSVPENREAHSKRMKEALDTPEWRERCSMRVGPLAANWQGGISNDPYCHKFNDDFRRNVRTFFENKCLLCLYEEVETLPQGRAFCVHHVHYDKQSLCNETSHRMFAPLCDIHHGVTNGDRKFWEDLLSGIITEVYNGRSYYSEEEWNQMKGQVPTGLPEPLELVEA